MRKLPIGPEEAFVLSRVDGHTSEADIAAATGLATERVRDSLARLLELGAIAIETPPDVAPPPPPPRRHEAAHSRHLLDHPVIEAASEHQDQGHPAAALYDPAELDEEVDLDLPRKRGILDLFYRLDSVNHYQLLDVPVDADKKAVKDAYYRVVTVFHPDRYFGKNVGAFKPKLEKIFGRLTEAHDILTRKRSREEYDQYLATQQRNQTLERMMSDERSQLQELERVRRTIEEQARMAERAAHNASPEGAGPTRTSSSPTVSVPPRSDPEARRRALARKLGRSSLRPPAPNTTPAPASAGPTDRAALKDELRRRYEQRLAGVKGEQIQRYLEAAEQSLQDGNPVSAANALRIAVSLDPSDQDLAARLDSLQARANAELAQSYLDQAQYEERSGRYLEAAQSYERAARGKPNARVFERAAHCLLEAQADLRKAGELAREAVSLAPDQAPARTTLARIYLAADMKQSALAEFERAVQLAPGDETIKNWIKRIKRGEV
jgi:curved DNA-binding protein CbpA